MTTHLTLVNESFLNVLSLEFRQHQSSARGFRSMDTALPFLALVIAIAFIWGLVIFSKNKHQGKTKK